MISSLTLANFKGIAGPEIVPIRPLTLIYGPNSAGKSSILQALLLLKQSAEHAENPEVALLPKGPHVNLGGYRELVHRHQAEQEFYVRLELDQPDRLRAPISVRAPLRQMGVNRLGLGIRFGFAGKAANSALRGIEVFADGAPRALITYSPQPLDRQGVPLRIRARMGRIDTQARTVALRADQIDEGSPVWDRLYQTAGKRRASEVRAEITARIDRLSALAAGLTDSASNVESFPRSSARGKQRQAVLEQASRARDEAEHLTMLRERIARYTKRKAVQDFVRDNREALLLLRNFLPIASADIREDRDEWTSLGLPRRRTMGVFGGDPWDLSRVVVYAADLVREFLDSISYLGPLREYPERHYVYSGTSAADIGKSGKMLPDVLYSDEELTERVNRELRRFGLGYELRVSRGDTTAELQDVFALRLVDAITGVNVNLTDVGFGVSQVLPVIVQSLMARQQVLLVEQPEIHLHPRLQAELTELFVSSINRPLSNIFLVESHSEHMILRTQRLIREGRLHPGDVSVVYADRTGSGTRLLPLRLDESGSFIDEWPGGFFEEGFQEIFG
jgi:hypothetical protein